MKTISRRKPGSKIGSTDPNAIKSFDSGKRGHKKVINVEHRENSDSFIKEQNKKK
jgi:hypothetical protein